uniref:Uncharacterized protein n=1 Tax=Buteo japonicus TaxID=224669 RepID=A0A8C0AR33_9AVES
MPPSTFLEVVPQGLFLRGQYSFFLKGAMSQLVGGPLQTPLTLPSPQARLLELCRHLGALRVRERSLSLGEAEAIPAGQAAAFLRSWDQSERFLVVLNPRNQTLHLALEDPRLPPQATL